MEIASPIAEPLSNWREVLDGLEYPSAAITITDADITRVKERKMDSEGWRTVKSALEGREEEASRLRRAMAEGEATVDHLTLDAYRRMTPEVVLAEWRRAQDVLHRAAAGLENHSRVAWYGPPMGAKTFLTARLMETWAHGRDIATAVGAQLPATDRLRHIARLGFITREWAYANRGRTPPPEPVQVTLTSPDGGHWTYGPDDAPEQVTGPAEDFCLVVTQRRHLDDTLINATPLARDWLLIAQAFAGPPTTGPAPAPKPVPARPPI